MSIWRSDRYEAHTYFTFLVYLSPIFDTYSTLLTCVRAHNLCFSMPKIRASMLWCVIISLYASFSVDFLYQKNIYILFVAHEEEKFTAALEDDKKMI